MTPSRAKRLLLVIIVAAVTGLWSGEERPGARAWISDVDTGVIAAMVDDTVYMRGQQGEHVFQLMGMCPWCEEGADIVAVFQGLTHATIAPHPNYFAKPTVRALVVKDAREQF